MNLFVSSFVRKGRGLVFMDKNRFYLQRKAVTVKCVFRPLVVAVTPVEVELSCLEPPRQSPSLHQQIATGHFDHGWNTPNDYHLPSISHYLKQHIHVLLRQILRSYLIFCCRWFILYEKRIRNRKPFYQCVHYCEEQDCICSNRQIQWTGTGSV